MLSPTTFLRQFKRIKRTEPSEQDFKDALKQILLEPKGEARSENREPTKAELQQRFRLERQ